MEPTRRILIGIVVLVCGGAGFATGRFLLRPSVSVSQPIAFNHEKHVAMIDCDSCHQYYETRQHSGLPGLSVCLECHEDAQTDSAEEQKVRDLAEQGQDQVFNKLFRLPDNVYYSHRRHVAVAGLECAACHGAIAETSSPPETPLVRVTMDFCIECHSASGVRTECTVCHR